MYTVLGTLYIEDVRLENSERKPKETVQLIPS